MNRPPMVSYAQNLEDVILARVFHDRERGSYVDVGANDPDSSSLTRHFYDAGWSGINIEPGSVFEKLQAARPRDVNLRMAISDTPGRMLFHEYPNAPLLSCLDGVAEHIDSELRANSQAVEVEVRPLRDVLADHPLPQIDFLSVDVEGHERQVLASNDWSRWRPRVCIVEATLPMQPIPNHQSWEPILLAAGYTFAYFDGLNRFYVRNESPELLERFGVPPNVFDHYILADVVRLQVQLEEMHQRAISFSREVERLRRTGLRGLLRAGKAVVGKLTGIVLNRNSA